MRHPGSGVVQVMRALPWLMVTLLVAACDRESGWTPSQRDATVRDGVTDMGAEGAATLDVRDEFAATVDGALLDVADARIDTGVDAGLDVMEAAVTTDVMDAEVIIDTGCAAGLTACDAGCVNTRTDRTNCGRCGRACTETQVCAAGAGCVEMKSCGPRGGRSCEVVVVRGGAPGTSFTLGETGAFGASNPQNNIRVDDFILDATEVTVERFSRYWNSVDAGLPPAAGVVRYPDDGGVITGGGVTEPTMYSGTDAGTSACNWYARYYDTPRDTDRARRPINCIDWSTALAFCVWDGGRLPTEAEWEWAARWRAVEGFTPGRSYVGGDDLPMTCDRGTLTIPPACGGGAREVSDTPLDLVGGLFDLTGNVSEWTADSYAEYSGSTSCWDSLQHENPLCVVSGSASHTYRGASFGTSPMSTPSYLHAASRFSETGRYPQIGVRCARPIPRP